MIIDVIGEIIEVREEARLGKGCKNFPEEKIEVQKWNGVVNLENLRIREKFTSEVGQQIGKHEKKGARKGERTSVEAEEGNNKEFFDRDTMKQNPLRADQDSSGRNIFGLRMQLGSEQRICKKARGEMKGRDAEPLQAESKSVEAKRQKAW